MRSRSPAPVEQELLLNPERECLRRQFVTGLADIQHEIGADGGEVFPGQGDL